MDKDEVSDETRREKGMGDGERGDRMGGGQ